MNRQLIAFVVVTLATASACGTNGKGSAATTASSTTVATSMTVVGLEQPAIWPAADVYFDSPMAAAKDFVTNVLKVPPVLGDFRQGDSRSGEIHVYSQPEGRTTKADRGTLLLRQLGSRSGWFVTAAVNNKATITTPQARTSVAPGSTTVAGNARGFEANVVVSAFIAGNPERFEHVITSGGTYDTPEPYSVTINLSSAKHGDIVMLLVRGGTGLETDPGDFGAIPVVVD